jgi:DtxR family Mn-dependent transcriptional regulator
VLLSAVIHTSSEFLKFLNGRDLKLGVKLKIRSVESFDQSVIVSYDGHPNEALSRIIAERLLVTSATETKIKSI